MFRSAKVSAALCGAHLLGVALRNPELVDWRWELLPLSVLALLPLFVAVEMALALLTGRLFRRGQYRGAAKPIVWMSAAAVAMFSWLFTAEQGHQGLAWRKSRGANLPSDVALIVLDTLRADHFFGRKVGEIDPEGRAVGMPLTMQALSDWQVMTYTDVESTAGWTLPAMATILSGAHSTGIEGASAGLGERPGSVAEIFRTQGYRTEAVVDNVLLLSRQGYGHGFNRYHHQSALRLLLQLPSYRWLPRIVRDAAQETLRCEYSGAPAIAGRSIRVLEEYPEPLFLWAHFMDAHGPHYDKEGPRSGVSFKEAARLAAGGQEKWAPAVVEQIRRDYRAGVEAMDGHVAALIEALGKRPRPVRLVIVADHGEELFDRGGLAHLHSLHRELVRVPMLVADSLQPPAWATEPGLTTTLEVVAALQGGTPEVQGNALSRQDRRGRRLTRVREGDRVEIYEARSEAIARFDLQRDPHEMTPIQVAADEREEFFAELPFNVSDPRRRSSIREDAGHSADEDEAALRALGYLD